MGGMKHSKLLQVPCAVEKEVNGENMSGYNQLSKSGRSNYKTNGDRMGQTSGSD